MESTSGSVQYSAGRIVNSDWPSSKASGTTIICRPGPVLATNCKSLPLCAATANFMAMRAGQGPMSWKLRINFGSKATYLSCSMAGQCWAAASATMCWNGSAGVEGRTTWPVVLAGLGLATMGFEWYCFEFDVCHGGLESFRETGEFSGFAKIEVAKKSGEPGFGAGPQSCKEDGFARRLFLHRLKTHYLHC